jgi:hypothetical protein
MSASSLHALACRVLSGTPVEWPFPSNIDCQSSFLQSTYPHGVQPLLEWRLRSSDARDSWPSMVLDALKLEAATQSVTELIQGEEIVNVLAALRRRGLTPLLMKGAALGRTHYASPHLRPHGDTDVLIRPSERDSASRVLLELGYRRANATSGDFVSYQDSWSKLDQYHVTHTFDVHWRVSNCQLFAQAMSYDELEARSVLIQTLGGRALGPVHALLMACMHRVGHVTTPWWGDDMPRRGDRLIWLYDIHLLAGRMSPQELAEFSQLAIDRQLVTICLDGLQRSRRLFGTPMPDEAFVAKSAAGSLEPSAHYLEPGRLRHMVRDILSLGSFGDKLSLAREHLVPPADYMMKRYGVAGRVWLPALYLRRAVLGAWRLSGLQGLHRLRARQRIGLFAGWVVVAGARVAISFLPFRRLFRLVQWTESQPRQSPRSLIFFRDTPDEDLAWIITTAAKYVPHASCLTQALAAQWIFAWLGRPTAVQVGVAKGVDKRLRVHAWLEREGRVVVGGEPLERDEYVRLPFQTPAAIEQVMALQ